MTDTNPLRADELRERLLHILKDTFSIGWNQGEREHTSVGGGKAYRDGGKVKLMIDGNVEQILELLTPPPSLASVVAEIEEAYEKSTPGEWFADPNGYGISVDTDPDNPEDWPICSTRNGAGEPHERRADTNLIRLLHNAWPLICIALTTSVTDAELLKVQDGQIKEYKRLSGLLQEKIDLLEANPALTISGTGWRDIESAPKDGTTIIACGPKLAVTAVHFHAERPPGWGSYLQFEPHWSRIQFRDVIGVINPTHWMPLPDAPQPKTGDA